MAKPSSTHRSIVADALRSAHRTQRRLRAIGLLAVLALSSSLGCRHIDNAQVDVLESELRKQEDYIYELEGYLMEYSEKLRQARAMQCDPVSTSSTIGSSSKEPTLDVESVKRPTLPMNGRNKLAPPAKSSLPAPPATTEAPPAAIETPAEPEEIDPDLMEAPALEIGPGVQASPWKQTLETASQQPLVIPDPIDYQVDGGEGTDIAESAERSNVVADAASREGVDGGLEARNGADLHGTDEGDAHADSSPVEAPILAGPQLAGARLAADHLQIRRVFAERRPENNDAIASLLIVVEALNATDEPVGAEGEASLMVMTRDESGTMRRVERWDFTPEETASAWQSSQLGDGLHLELPLASAELPTDADLELWARIVTADGRKLLTQVPLEPATLASMTDFRAEESLAAQLRGGKATTESLEPIPVEETVNPQIAAAPITKTAAAEPKPAWRPSTTRLNDGRVEGYATTAGQPAGAAGQPTWKRSSAAGSEGNREATTFR